MASKSLPQEKVMNLTEARQQLSRVVNQVARGETRVVVEKSGAPVAAIISQQEFQEYKRLKEKDDQLRQRLEQSLTAFSTAFEDVSDEELGRVLVEARREYRKLTDREHGRA